MGYLDTDNQPHFSNFRYGILISYNVMQHLRSSQIIHNFKHIRIGVVFLNICSDLLSSTVQISRNETPTYVADQRRAKHTTLCHYGSLLGNDLRGVSYPVWIDRKKNADH